MKVFKDEKIWVQAKDLVLLFNTDNAIPFSVWGITLSNRFWKKKGHDFDFIEFDSKLIDYFDRLSWIIDFDKVMKFDNEDIEKEINKHSKLIKKIDKVLDRSLYDKENNIIFDLKAILYLKNNNRFVISDLESYDKNDVLSKRLYYFSKR